MLVDKNMKSNILHFTSYKWKFAARSVNRSEVYAFAQGFDFTFYVNHDLERFLHYHIQLKMITDFQGLFVLITEASSIK